MLAVVAQKAVATLADAVDGRCDDHIRGAGLSFEGMIQKNLGGSFTQYKVRLGSS